MCMFKYALTFFNQKYLISTKLKQGRNFKNVQNMPISRTLKKIEDFCIFKSVGVFGGIINWL